MDLMIVFISSLRSRDGLIGKGYSTEIHEDAICEFEMSTYQVTYLRSLRIVAV